MKSKLSMILFAALALAACKADENKRVSESADNIGDQQRDLSRAEGDQAKSSARVARESAELSKADVSFDSHKAMAIDGYQRELTVFASQAAIARGMLADKTMTDEDHAKATGAVITFERDLSNATAAVENLKTATADTWDDQASRAESAINDMRDAQDDAFSALSVKRTIVSAVPGA